MPSLVLVHNPPKRDARGRFLPAPAGRKRNPPKDATATELANTAELYGAKASLLSAGGYEIHMRPEHGGTYLGRFENREKAIRFLRTLKVPKRNPKRNPPKGKAAQKGKRWEAAYQQVLEIVRAEHPRMGDADQQSLAGRTLAQLVGAPGAGGTGTRQNPPNRAGVISRDVHEIKYRHAENGLDYFHPFTRNDVELIAMTDGTLRIRSRSGKPLWHNFPEGAR